MIYSYEGFLFEVIIITESNVNHKLRSNNGISVRTERRAVELRRRGIHLIEFKIITAKHINDKKNHSRKVFNNIRNIILSGFVTSETSRRLQIKERNVHKILLHKNERLSNEIRRSSNKMLCWLSDEPHKL